jgi:hypothetical protein
VKTSTSGGAAKLVVLTAKVVAMTRSRNLMGIFIFVEWYAGPTDSLDGLIGGDGCLSF